MSENRQLMTIVITPDIEDIVVDWLLERPEVERFNSYQIKSYNKDHSEYTVIEKVTGWKRKIAIRVLFPTDTIPLIIEGLKNNFKNSGIYYRITPFLDEGVI